MRDKYRVLFVHPTVNHTNGPDICLFELISRLDQERYELFLVVPEYTPLIDKFCPFITRYIISDDVRIVSPPNNPFSAVRYIIQSLRAVPRMAQLLADNKIDLVHSNVESTWRMGLAARIKNIPSIIHIRGLTSIGSVARSRLVPKILQLVGDVFIAVSEGVAKAYTETGLSSENLHVVPNGVDLRKFQPTNKHNYLHENYNLPPSSTCIGAIGSADPRKGWAYLVMAFALVKKHNPDTYCFLVGNKPSGDILFYQNYSYLQILYGLVESLNITDSLFTPGVIQEMQNVYDSLILVVQPSLTEAGPRVVLESMAMGKPVVATRVPGNSSYLPEGEAGLLTPIRDIEAMACAIRQLLDDSASRERMSLHARSYVEQEFSIDEQVVKLDQIFTHHIEAVRER